MGCKPTNNAFLAEIFSVCERVSGTALAAVGSVQYRRLAPCRSPAASAVPLTGG